MANVTAPSSNWSVDRETGHVDVLTLWIVAADGFICVSGLVGNALVIYVISRASFKSKTATTNAFILNLSVTDTLFLLGLPMIMTTAVALGYRPSIPKVRWG